MHVVGGAGFNGDDRPGIAAGRHHDIHEEAADAAVAIHIRVDVDEYEMSKHGADRRFRLRAQQVVPLNREAVLDTMPALFGTVTTVHCNGSETSLPQASALSFLQELRYSSGAPDRRIETPAPVRFLLDKCRRAAY